MDHEEEKHDNPHTEQESEILIALSIFLARIICWPLRTVLRIIEAVGVLSVGLSAGLLVFSMMGLYSSGLRSILMWALLAVSLAIPALYYELQIDSDAISDTREDVVAEKIYRCLMKKLPIGKTNVDEDRF